MESLQDLLSRQQLPEEPQEARTIKRLVQEELNEEVSVTVRENDIIINVRSAALANALRMRGPALQKACRTTKRLIFRIAH